jgi:A/G-specific adenine glycosylase
MAEHAGEFPKTVHELRELPGIGRYTAGAIASFAFDVSAPILEANTLRLYARLMGYAADPRTTEGQATLWRFAEEIVPSRQAGAFNQGAIDLGALVCTPVDPQCSECPLMEVCVAFQTGRQNQIPLPKSRPAVTEVHEAAIAIRRGGRWLVRQRPRDERWAGMWDFPRLPLQEPILRGNGHAGVMTEGLYQSTGLKTNLVSMLEEFTHSVTRYRMRLARSVVEYESGEWSQTTEHRWLSLEELVELPMPMAARRFVADLAEPGWDPEEVLQLSGRRGKRR